MGTAFPVLPPMTPSVPRTHAPCRIPSSFAAHKHYPQKIRRSIALTPAGGSRQRIVARNRSWAPLSSCPEMQPDSVVSPCNGAQSTCNTWEYRRGQLAGHSPTARKPVPGARRRSGEAIPASVLISTAMEMASAASRRTKMTGWPPRPSRRSPAKRPGLPHFPPPPPSPPCPPPAPPA